MRRLPLFCCLLISWAVCLIARADDSPPDAAGPAAMQQGAEEPAKKPEDSPEVEADPNAPTVGSSLDRSEAHLGDQLTLTVTAVARTATAATVKLAQPDLGKFEVLDRADSDQDLGDGKTRRRFVFQIAAYELGELEIPAIAIDFAGTTGGTRQVKTAPLPVRIGKVVDDPKAEMQPLAHTRDVLVEDKRPLQAIAAAAALIVLLILALVARALNKRRQRRPIVERPKEVRPPHEIALERLRELRRNGRFDLDGYRPFHFAVAEVLRGYLGARFGFDSLEQTTTELLAELNRARTPAPPAMVVPAPGSAPVNNADSTQKTQAANPAGEIDPSARPNVQNARPDARLLDENFDRIRAFLDSCDLVKFAKAPANDESAIALLDTAESIVRATTVNMNAPAAAKVENG